MQASAAGGHGSVCVARLRGTSSQDAVAFAFVAQPEESWLCGWWQQSLQAARCVQVAVPDADMEELLPAARLLSRATAVTPGDYEQAKGVFLQGLQNAGAQAEVRPSRPVLS